MGGPSTCKGRLVLKTTSTPNNLPLFKDLYKEFKIRNPKKSGFFRVQVGHGAQLTGSATVRIRSRGDFESSFDWKGVTLGCRV